MVVFFLYVLFEISNPHGEIVEGYLFGDIINQNYSLSLIIELLAKGSVSLLSSSVPELYMNFLSINID